MRMRTLPQAVQLLRQEDPETAITLTALRRMVKQGKLPVTKAGSKPLIDLDKLPEYLQGAVVVPPPAGGGIRPIKE